MKRSAFVIVGVVLLAGTYFLGVWSGSRPTTPPSGAAAVRKVLYYVDPMHPAYKSDKPGVAPDCGMELVPVYEDGRLGDPAPGGGSTPGVVTVSADKQQLLGVRTARVAKAPVNHIIRAVGRVAPDESRLYRITAATDGWVRKMMPPTTGSVVAKDEVLAHVFSSEFFAAMKAFLYGVRSLDRVEANRREVKEQLDVNNANLENYRNSLRNLGMSETQLDEILRTRQGSDSIEVRAPVGGLVLARNLSPGQRFDKGTELYRIVDLSRVWILADTFEAETRAFQPGRRVQLKAPNLAKTLEARVADVPPNFDATTRTMKVRLDVDNPGFVLRPDMFVDVELPIQMPASIVVPADAVVDSGAVKTVYLVKGAGVFEPRTVQTGWRHGEQIEIVQGLTPGEEIVVAGTFLVDSESRMKAAAAGATAAASPDPVCGMAVDPVKAKAQGRLSVVQGTTYYFCSDDCKVRFDQTPDTYIRKAGSGATTVAGQRLDRVQWRDHEVPEGYHHQHAGSMAHLSTHSSLP